MRSAAGISYSVSEIFKVVLIKISTPSDTIC